MRPKRAIAARAASSALASLATSSSIRASRSWSALPKVSCNCARLGRLRDARADAAAGAGDEPDFMHVLLRY
jgi:hypothetical protein